MPAPVWNVMVMMLALYQDRAGDSHARAFAVGACVCAEETTLAPVTGYVMKVVSCPYVFPIYR